MRNGFDGSIQGTGFKDFVYAKLLSMRDRLSLKY